MPLTDKQIKAIQPTEKDQRHADEKGLVLLVKPNGSKYWRLKYRFARKQKILALGVYPTVSLKEARLGVAEARKQISEGIDPSRERRAQKLQAQVNQENSLESVARAWWHNEKGKWNEKHSQRIWRRLNDNVLKYIGGLPITEVDPQHIIQAVRKVEGRDALDVSERVLQDVRRVCRYAVQVGILKVNPARELSGILKARTRGHRPSLPAQELPGFLLALDGYRGRLLTQLGLKLLILTFVRPGELRGARWSEFDLQAKLWRIPGERMKMGTDHIVPLSEQSLEVLEQLQEISGQYELLFPSERERARPMSDNTLGKAIRVLGYDGQHDGKTKATPHGFRATASSILNESGFNPDAIERQLSHMERNGVRAAYTHHAQYLDERTKMMQWWADYLDQQKAGHKVVPILSKRA